MRKKFNRNTMVSLASYSQGDTNLQFIDKQFWGSSLESASFRVIFKELKTGLYYVLRYENWYNTNPNESEEFSRATFRNDDGYEVECDEVIPYERILTDWVTVDE